MSSSFPNRKNIRYQGYDYTLNGAYFVTLVTWKRECLFGEIVGEEMRLNELGCVLTEVWETTPHVRPNVMLDEYIVMPDHFHGIIRLDDDRRGDPLGRPDLTGRGNASPLPYRAVLAYRL